jgi:hypothetical protein
MELKWLKSSHFRKDGPLWSYGSLMRRIISPVKELKCNLQFPDSITVGSISVCSP